MMSKVGLSHDTTKHSALKKPTKVATVRQQLAYNHQTHGSIVEPSSNQHFTSVTLPPGNVQPPTPAISSPFSRIQSLNISGLSSVPNSPCCPGGSVPRFVGRIPIHQHIQPQLYPHQQQASIALPYPVATFSTSTLSCIATPQTHRNARHLAKQALSSEETLKTPSSSTSSRDSGIMSQDSSTSSHSFTNDDFIAGQQLCVGGVRTPQCVQRRTKQAGKMVVETPTIKLRGSNGINRVVKNVNNGRKMPSASNSVASSPATPRASWTSSSSTGGENESVKASSNMSYSTSHCSQTLEWGKKRRHTPGRPDSIEMTATAAINSDRVQRPTNLARDSGSKAEQEETSLAKKVHQIFKKDEKTCRNSSVSLGCDRQFIAPAQASQIPGPRGKTLSPPPQIASSKVLPNHPPANSITPDSSSTSTCTLAIATRGFNASFLNRVTSDTCSNLDDTPTPSISRGPECHVDSSAAPQAAMEGFENLTILKDSISSRSPSLSLQTAGAGDDPPQGSLGYGPLSHIKLPYSTPVMQRMQQTKSKCGFGIGCGGYSRREKSVIDTPSVSEAFGSHLSLSTPDTAALEEAKLRRELKLAHQKVAALTFQLSANAKVIQAFEQGLQSMNQRLYQLSVSSAFKEREVQELRTIIDRFRCQALQADWLFTMGNPQTRKKLSQSQEFVASHHALESVGSLSSLVHSPPSITDGGGESYGDFGRYLHDPPGRGFLSPNYAPLRDSFDRTAKKSGWLRASFSRAFRRSKSRDPPDCGKVTSTSSHALNFQTAISSSSLRHSPISSSGDSPSITGKMESEEGGESLATDVGVVMELMQETVRRLQHEVHCLNAENANLQRAVNISPFDTPESLASISTSGAASFSNNSPRIMTMIRDLFAITSETGQNPVPVFLELKNNRMPHESIDEGHASAPSCSSPNCLSLSGLQIGEVGSASPNMSTRALTEGTKANNSYRLFLLGRICFDPSTVDLRTKLRNLFQTYLNYLDSEDQLGLTAEGISSICIKTVPRTIDNGQPVKDLYVSLQDNTDNTLTIESSYEVSCITLSLHESTYGLERPVSQNRLNPITVSTLAWISLLSVPLLGKMIESLVTNRCVVIYGPKGSGKLEFGRILIDSMAKMFPGFWTSQPNVVQYCLLASSNAVNELRQALLSALPSIEGSIILRLPASLLPDLVNIMTELGFNTPPRKIMLLVITDTLIFPEESTKLRNCPGIFPFLADIQSASTYMRRCLRQRFSQFAFQCLGAPSMGNADELNALTEVIEWLPEFWLRFATASAWSSLNDGVFSASTFALSPFRLLACPLTIQASFMWFCEVCNSEGVFRRAGESNQNLIRWLASTWPWSNEKLPFVFSPLDRMSFSPDPIMTTSTSASMIMYDSSASLPALLPPTGSGQCMLKTPPSHQIRR